MPTLEAVTPHLTGMVRDVMTKEVQTAAPTALVGEVANQMSDSQTRRIIIVDAQQRVLGVVSQRDILRHYMVAAEQQDSSSPEACLSVEIQTLIGRDKPVTVLADLQLIKAAAVLAANKAGCLPVVGLKRELLGILTTSDVIRRVTGHGGESFEKAFQLYTPASVARVKLPAYIRKLTGELVVPMKCMDNREAVQPLVVLGYDGKSGRILAKFVSEGTENEGAMRTRVEEDCLVISASGFVTHFELVGKTSAFDVSVHKDNKYLVLSPRQTT
ncbi:MAG TPA: CBS domain-containing protein [Pirellulaceae bacterium]|nr:CBS domain-containing protein [Pirellulaceae bacterium]